MVCRYNCRHVRLSFLGALVVFKAPKLYLVISNDNQEFILIIFGHLVDLL
jgi:hypothetical protein